MVKKISVKTELGWVSASENMGKIFEIKFGKVKKQSQSQVLKNFKKNLIKFFKKGTLNIEAPYKIQGSKIQKKVWSELVIQCHRVIRSDGNLGGFTSVGGVKLKKKYQNLKERENNHSATH